MLGVLCFILTLAALTLTLIYIKLKKCLNYWNEKGIVGPEPNIIFGSFKGTYLKELSYAEETLNIYLKYRNYPVIGVYNMMKPFLLVNDPEYIEKVLKTDFSSFTDRTPSKYSEYNVMHRNLFNLNGPKWKAMRNKISPVFTTLKLKSMMTQMAVCFENTSNYIEENISNEIDMKEVSSIFSHDVIVQCLFGIESKDLSRPGTRFRRMQTEFFNMTWLKLINFAFMDVCPKLAQYFKLSYFPCKTVDYFKKLVEMALNQRMGKKSDRNDLIQLLLKMKEKQTIDIYDWDHSEDEGGLDNTTPIETVQVTDELLESQALIFFNTGVESLVASFSLAVFELARCPEALAKLRREISSVEGRQGLTQKSVQNMTYLDMCIKETLRLYPIVPHINRICSRRYEFPCGLVLEPGEMIAIPICGVHRDQEYYPDPDSFKPERFLVDPAPFTYLPFGEGPRICFAMKFVLTELKVGLCKLIQRYDFEMSPRTELPIKFVYWTPFIKPLSPIWINFSKRE